MLFSGPLAEHMAVHIVMMSIVAPLTACAARRWGSPWSKTGAFRWLGVATLAQMALLWIWHAPAVLAWAWGSATAHALMQLSLLLAAVWFWIAVLNAVMSDRWRAIVALLITGKLFCLLGALLVFAPRVIYEATATLPPYGSQLSGGSALADQQLAGLLMVIACPLTYVLAGVILAARWLSELDGRPAPPSDHPSRYGPVAPESSFACLSSPDRANGSPAAPY